MIVFLNNEFVGATQAKVSVFDHGFLYGDGCFETLRTYGGELFRAEEHVQRLKKSAENLQIDFPWKTEEIKLWMVQTVQENGFKESRLRITITRGENGFNFIGSKKPTILIVASELIPHPQKIYKTGVNVETFKIERMLPQVKSLNILPSILGQQVKKANNVFETLFIDHEGYITEGTVSNFFIIKNGKIITAPDKYVLSGITREVTFELAKKLGYKVEKKQFTLEEALQADEAFLTSTVMDIAPVVQIGEIKVGNGTVGEVTRTLIQNFCVYVDACC